MRVALLTNIIPPYQQPVLAALAKRYTAFRVLLSTPMEPNRPWAAEWGDLDVVIQKTRTTKGLWQHPRGFREPLDVHIPLDTFGQLRRFRPDVVVSAELGARTLLALAYRLSHPRTRLLIWVEAADENEVSRGLMRRGLRSLLVRRADGFLAVGSGTVRYLESLGVALQLISRVSYTALLEAFAAVPLARPLGSAHRLLFCGQFIERKGLEPFLKVLARWANDHPERLVSMALAGDGPLRERLAHRPLPPNVKLEFLGTLSYAELPGAYGSAGVFVLPTLADTWAVVVNEALASGVPVLGSVYAQAVKELIQDGQNGWTFRPDDEQDTYRSIDKVMKTPSEDLERMRAAARQTAVASTPEGVASLIGQAIEAQQSPVKV